MDKKKMSLKSLKGQEIAKRGYLEEEEEPPLQPGEFEVCINAEKFLGCDPGIDLDVTDPETLLVLRVRSGPFKEWNESQEDKQLHVRHLDRIMEVNGVQGDCFRLELGMHGFKKESHEKWLKLRLRRPQEFELDLRKSASGDGAKEAKVGLDVVTTAMESLLVKRVKEGLVKRWNSSNPEQAIQQGDRIVEVNKIRGDSQRMLEAVGGEDELHIVVSRTR